MSLKLKIAYCSLSKLSKISLLFISLSIGIIIFSLVSIHNKKSSIQPLKKFTSYNKIIYKDIDLVNCTVYNPTPSQCWGSGDILYDGTKIKKEISSGYRYVSVSRDLLKKYPIGSHLKAYCFEKHEYYTGVWTVRDKMNNKKSNHIDFLQADLKMKLDKNYCFIIKL